MRAYRPPSKIPHGTLTLEGSTRAACSNHNPVHAAKCRPPSDLSIFETPQLNLIIMSAIPMHTGFWAETFVLRNTKLGLDTAHQPCTHQDTVRLQLASWKETPNLWNEQFHHCAMIGL